MNNDGLEFSEIAHAIAREKGTIALSILACTVAFGLSTFFLPRKYKSTAIVSIQAGYFQAPLIRDISTEISDNSELKSSRESLIARALNEPFLQKFGSEYGFLNKPESDPRHSIEIAELRKRIEITQADATSFTIGFVGKEPLSTLKALQDLLAQITKGLSQERFRGMVRLRDSIQKRVETIALAMGRQTDPLIANRPEILNEELAEIQVELASLRTQYSESHPAVRQLNSRAEQLKALLKKQPAGNEPHKRLMSAPLLGGQPTDPNLSLYSDLLKKLNYLNITLDMENETESPFVSVIQAPALPEQPAFPRRSIFLAWGLLSGVLLALFVVLAKQYSLAWTEKPKAYALNLGIEVLGAVPELGPKKSRSTDEAKVPTGAQPDVWQ